MPKGGDRDRQNEAAAGRKAFLEKKKKEAREETWGSKGATKGTRWEDASLGLSRLGVS